MLWEKGVWAEPQTLRKYFKYVNINKHREASISFNIYK